MDEGNVTMSPEKADLAQYETCCKWWVQWHQKANQCMKMDVDHLEVRSEDIRTDVCATSCSNAAFTRNPLGILQAMNLHHYRRVASKRGRP